MLKNVKAVSFVIGILVVFWATLLLVSGFGTWSLNRSASSLRDVHDVRMQRNQWLETMEKNIIANRLEVLLMFQHDSQGALRDVHDHEIAVHFDSYARRREATQAAFASLQKDLPDADDQRLMATLVPARQAWVEQADKALAAIRRGEFTAPVMAAYLKAGRAEGEALLKAIEAAAAHQVEAAGQAAAAAEQAHRRMLWAIALAALVLGVPGTLASVMLVSRLRRGFSEADEVASAIAQGNLTHRYEGETGNDEIGHLLRNMHLMQDNLVRVISQVRTSADSIDHAAAEVAAGNADLSHRTEQTASNLQQTASSADQLGTTVQTNAENAEQANRLAASASEVASRGGSVVSQVVGTMREIDDSSKKIADIIGVIDGIAFQTNILALNAAVEAARAGESGRGFAVVAGEVRALAQRSADAAREIKSLIQASVERVENGTRQADEAGQTMAEVVNSIRSVTDIVAEISQASREQSQGVSTVGAAVSAMDAATQQNAALVEQSAAAAESLRAQAQQLVQAVGAFRLA